MADLVNWRYAQSTAALLGKTGPQCSLVQAREAVGQLRELAAAASAHVTEVTGLSSDIEAPVRVVDRQDWIAANAEGFRTTIEPAMRRTSKSSRPGPLAHVSSAAMGLQVGAALAFVSSRVLGQYEIFGKAPGQLLLVAPNVISAERKLEVDPRDFRLWICLHEITHQLQFTGVPWLRGHFLARIEELLDTSSALDVLRSPEKRQRLTSLTSLMTLVEGHAEYVMDAVGPRVVPSVGTIRDKFDARRRSANPIQRVLRYVLGVEHKLRQYVEGKRFVAEVVEAVGMSGFNTVWRDAQALPSKAELSEPRLWLERVRPASAAG